MNVKSQIEQIISQALTAAGAEGAPALIAVSSKPEFGDYQANGVMAAAKKLKTNPRQLAQKVLDAAGPALAEIADKVEIAGPGFLNITLKPAWLAARLAEVQADDHLGAERPAAPQRVVVDYSAPNLAKEMHVGHLRSTIIGDCLARVLSFAGRDVIRQNHVGDWGTQFGMLIAHLEDKETAAGDLVLSDIEQFYRDAKKAFDNDPAFAERSRQTVVRLQKGDAEILKRWRHFLDLSLRHAEDVYARLGVLLTREDVRGESAYNDDLPGVIAELSAKGMIAESQGAQCVFLDEFKGKDGTPLPLIVQKSDEGYLYATTDLAAIRYRVGTLKADRIIYAVDMRQSLHFRQVFATARKAGFAPEAVSLEHVGFGTMMGEDGKPFKTRTGGTVKLMELLDEAVERARKLIDERAAADAAKGTTAPLDDEQKQKVAQAVGIGAVKYFDLAQNRASDYVFSWDRMLSLDGNTAPYMQYAYARIRSIYRKGGLGESHAAGAIAVAEPAERTLAVRLLQFPEAVATVAADCLPNVLCAYLYDLAHAFTTFYESCPVLKSDEPIRTSRLALCDLTARTIKTGLGLLGIETIEQM